jgi:hypothetical protein
MIDFDARVTHSSPVFDQRGPHYMARAADEGSYEVATYVRRSIISYLLPRFKHATGHYVSTLAIVQAGPGWMVDGDRTVYGRWLEGTGSMNFPATRFKGYRAFQTVSRRVRVRAAAIAWPAIRPWVRRLGGR